MEEVTYKTIQATRCDRILVGSFQGAGGANCTRATHMKAANLGLSFSRADKRLKDQDHVHGDRDQKLCILSLANTPGSIGMAYNVYNYEADSPY